MPKVSWHQRMKAKNINGQNRSLRECYAVVTSPGNLTLQQYCEDLKPCKTGQNRYTDNDSTGESNTKLPSTLGTLLPTKRMIRPR